MSIFSVANLKKQGVIPPTAKKTNHVHRYHGRDFPDPYHWLKQKRQPKVLAHFEAENAYSETVMAPTRALQDDLYRDMLSRIREDDASVPTRYGDWWYYTRIEGGKSYKIHCRRRLQDGEDVRTLQAELRAGGSIPGEQLLFDENELASGHSFFHFVDFGVNPSHTVAAYAYDTSGAQKYTLGFRNLETGKTIFEKIDAHVTSFAWEGERAFYYTSADVADRSRYLYSGTLDDELAQAGRAEGSAPKKKREWYDLVYNEGDPLFSVTLQESKDGRYIFLECTSSDTSEVLLVSRDDKSDGLRSVYGRTPNIEYQVDEREDLLYLIEYGATPNGRLLVAPVEAFHLSDNRGSGLAGISDPQAEKSIPLLIPGNIWRELIPETPEVVLQALECFRDYVVLFERRDGVKSLSILDRDHARRELAFERPIRNIGVLWNPEYASPTFRVSYSTFTTPSQVREYDAADGTHLVLKQEYAGEDFDSAHYIEERLFATSADGTRIPISLAYRKDGIDTLVSRPLHLYGYGSYGVTPGVGYAVDRAVLLDRGVIYAKAHIRGGGEYGRPWYEAGKMERKENTFTDFITCIEHLHREGYGSPATTTIEGASAGGLLVGAVVNKRPDLVRGAIAGVPFVDVVHTMMDTTLASTTLEYSEWGDPRELADFERMCAYTPTMNVRAQAYPIILATAGLNDPLVNCWEPAKWVARLREHTTSDNAIILKVNMGAGHQGASGRYDALREQAFELAFLLSVVAQKRPSC